MIPKSFIREFLRLKGWKALGILDCHDCGIYASDEEMKHPIKWLWEHASKGHAVGFSACSSWDRQIGRSGWCEEWWKYWQYRWYNGKFELVYCDMGADTEWGPIHKILA
jgi:hypothetical protein